MLLLILLEIFLNMSFSVFTRHLAVGTFAAALAGSALTVQSQVVSTSSASAPKVVIEASGVAITTLDLEAELTRAPAEVRANISSRPDAMAQLASNLLLRRALSKQAETAMLPTLPINQALLQLARDRVLSDLQLARISDMNRPSEAVLEARAREIYRADTTRFAIKEEVQARHILIMSTSENAEDKAKAALKELKDGADFARLAQQVSEDTGSGTRGGDLGYFGRGRMVKEFEDVAFRLQPGETSDIVKSQFGYHIIQVTDRKKAGKQPFEEVRDVLLNDAAQAVINEARLKAGQQIMSGAKTHPEVLDEFIERLSKSK